MNLSKNFRINSLKRISCNPYSSCRVVSRSGCPGRSASLSSFVAGVRALEVAAGTGGHGRRAIGAFRDFAHDVGQVLFYPPDASAQVVQQFDLPDPDGYGCCLREEQFAAFSGKCGRLCVVGGDGTAPHHVAQHFGVDALDARMVGAEQVLQKAGETFLYRSGIERIGPFECPGGAERDSFLAAAHELHGRVPCLFPGDEPAQRAVHLFAEAARKEGAERFLVETIVRSEADRFPCVVGLRRRLSVNCCHL